MKQTKKLLIGLIMLCIAITGAISTSQTVKAAESDFVIENGVLTKYNGSGGDVVIPDGVTEIGNNAFWECSSLTSVMIPDGVTEIGDMAFKRCARLQEINVDTKNISYSSENGVLYNKGKTILMIYPDGKTGDFKIPNSVTNIEANAFLECSGLTSITIPNSVTQIRHSAFTCYENLVSITIPYSVTSIGENAFAGCDNLEEMIILNPKTEMPIDYIGDCILGFGDGPTDFKNPVVTIKGHKNSTAQELADYMNQRYPTETTFQFVPLDGTGDNNNPTPPDNPQQPTNPSNPTTPNKPQQPSNPVVTPQKPTTPVQNQTYKLLQKVKATKNLTIKKGKSKTIKVTIPKGLKKVTKFSGKKKNQIKITYKSLNKKVATVTSKGKVKAKKKGTAKIKISMSAHDGKGVSVRGLTVKVKVK